MDTLTNIFIFTYVRGRSQRHEADRFTSMVLTAPINPDADSLHPFPSDVRGPHPSSELCNRFPHLVEVDFSLSLSL